MAQATIIRGGRILDPKRDGAPAADILIRDGVIREIGAPGMPAPADALTVDAADRLLVPGLVNAHTHAHGALGRGGVKDRVSLEMFLTASPALNGARTLDDKYLSAALSAVELVRKGCTACYDLVVEYPLPSIEGLTAVGQAYRDVGMRAVIAPMMADRTLYTALPGLLDALRDPLRQRVEAMAVKPFGEAIAACEQALRDWPFDRQWVRPAIAPTIPLHCSDDFMVACGGLAREGDIGLQTHLAESKTQAVLGLRKYGRSLTAHLEALGLLNARFSAAHGIWLDRDDARRLAHAGAAVAHNPLSNLRLGSGIAPVQMLRAAGVCVVVGTDASNTSDGQSMFEATRLASYLSRVQGEDHDGWITAAEALEMATTGSARILGMEGIGAIAPGFAADIVFLDLGSPHFVPLRSPLLQTVFAEAGASIRSVMIGGRIVLDGGKLLTIDEAGLRRRAEAAALRLDEANAPSAALGDAAERLVGAFCVAHAHGANTVARTLAAQ